MKKFKDHLLEASLSRVFNHTQNRNIGIISANRNNLTPKENKIRTSHLKSEIAKYFGYITIKGSYIENKGQPDERKVEEISFLVIGNNNDSGNLKGFLKKEGEKYQQDSILYKPADSEIAVLIGTTEGQWPGKGKEEPVGKFHPNKISDYKSILRHAGQSFTFSEDLKLEQVYELEGYFTGGDTFFSRKETLF